MRTYEITYDSIHDTYILWIKSITGYAKVLKFKTKQEAEKYVKDVTNNV